MAKSDLKSLKRVSSLFILTIKILNRTSYLDFNSTEINQEELNLILLYFKLNASQLREINNYDQRYNLDKVKLNIERIRREYSGLRSANLKLQRQNKLQSIVEAYEDVVKENINSKDYNSEVI